MLLENSDKVMALLKPDDVVLDIGGWAHPFNRANYVLDQEPYETRGYYNRTFARNNPFPPLGGTKEYFTRDTWIERDICDKQPYPFHDKQLDYVICSHTLEDIRDPLWVCAEMIRIAKRGYIEVPSRAWESARGSEPGIVGLSHHRWLIDITANGIRFLQKYHAIHGHWRWSLPASYLRRLTPEQKVQWLFWEDRFDFCELTLHGDEQRRELERFVQATASYPGWLLAADGAARKGLSFGQRGWNFVRRRVHG